MHAQVHVLCKCLPVVPKKGVSAFKLGDILQ